VRRTPGFSKTVAEAFDLTLDRGGAVPIAQQIAGRLLDGVLRGEIAPGQQLPAERSLAEKLGVSRGTVKRAYSQLQQSGAIAVKRGSGSYVLDSAGALTDYRKGEAIGIISAACGRLRAIGLSEQEIQSLLRLQTLAASGRERKVAVMVVSNNHDILSQLEGQLSYLAGASPCLLTLTFLTIDTIAQSADPAKMLSGYDLIIATSIDFGRMRELAPGHAGRVMEARLSPRTDTMMRLAAFARNTVFMVVYRTPVFLAMVRRCLLSLGFPSKHILACQEREYDPPSHGENGVGAVLNFNESPVLIDPRFALRNEAFEKGGGAVVRFEYVIERSSLVEIEHRLGQLLEAQELA